MRLPQILVLTGKELLWGPKNFVFIMAVVTPIVLSFMVTAMFGGLFADQPRLGIYDEGDSQLTLSALKSTTFKAGEYLTAEEMIQDARSGAVDMGIVLPAEFDSAINAGQT
ncbi:MAG: ABC transporter permease, partial [Dehalococcoidales bacterium]